MPYPLPSVPKRFRAGTHRAAAPEETLERLRPLLPVFGITRVANVTGLDIAGVPVVMVCRPNARSLAVSQGKGLDLRAARASGLMESIELYHAERVLAPLVLASFNELRFTHALVDVDAVPHTSAREFHPGLRLLWIEGRELLSGTSLWLPFELVHTNYTLPLPPGSGAFLPVSNGLASGNHLLEAISHGICEVVERDATTLWHFWEDADCQRRQVALETVDDAACREVMERLARAGLEVALWDITSDVGIAVFMCVLFEAPGSLRPVGPALGYGCHPSRGVALLRALTEAAQTRLTVIAGSRDDLLRRYYVEARDPRTPIMLRAWTTPEPGRSFREAPTWESPSMDGDVKWELERLQDAGITQVVVVDLTRPEFGIPVARVVIPGLEGPSNQPDYVPGPRARRWLEEHA